MKRSSIALASVIGVLTVAYFASVKVALGQQQPQCFPAEVLAAQVQSGALEAREVWRDADDDPWMVVDRKSDGASFLVVLIRAANAVCPVAIRPPQAKEGNPGRGA